MVRKERAAACGPKGGSISIDGKVGYPQGRGLVQVRSFTKRPGGVAHPERKPRTSSFVIAGCVAVAVLLSAAAAFAAGSPGYGDPLFYPCTSCHPVLGDGKRLPNGFKEHKITLVGHDVLGTTDDVCEVCHQDAAHDPGKLRVVGDEFVDIAEKDQTKLSKVCHRCHARVYRDWENGSHGANKDKCTESGCHNPHSPGVIFGEMLLPFVGNGFSAVVAPETQDFTPLAGPPVPAPVTTPQWLIALTVVGVVAAGGMAGSLVKGRSKR